MRDIVVTEANPEALPQARKWGQSLMGERRVEAVESLRREKVQRESAFVVVLENKPYLIHLSDAEGDVLPADMSMPVNIEHKRVNRLVMKPETRVKAELLYDISASS
jgi:hypothetical protein